VRIGPGVLAGAGPLLREGGLPDRVHVAADRNTLGACPGLLESLTSAGFEISLTLFDDLTHADMAAVERLCAEGTGAEALLAVGSGSLNDAARLASFRLERPYAVFGTAPSMDGYASTVAPVLENGYKRTYPAHAPLCILADSGVLASSPARLRSAGAGDLYGKYTALADWRVAHLLTGEYYCERVAGLMEDAVAKGAEGAVMEALVFSGIAMQLCGTSRPASGAEHHIAHFWEMLSLRDGREGDLHGRMVGVGALLVLREYKLLGGLKYVTALPDRWDANNIARVFGALADDIVKENSPGPLHNVNAERVAALWPEIRGILAGLPGLETVESALRAAGAPVTMAELGLSEDMAALGLRYGRYVRDRLTVLRLCDVLNV